MSKAMTQQGKRQGKRAAILKAAGELFSEKEFHLALMDEVAARAHVGKGTLYRYFPTKEDLYFATVLEGWDRLREELEEVLREERPLEDTLERIIRQILSYFWQRRHFVSLVYSLEHKAGGKEKADWQRRRDEIVRLVEGVLRKGRMLDAFSADDVRLVTELFLGMTRAVVVYRRMRDTPEALAHLLVSLFLDGLRGHARHDLNHRPPPVAGKERVNRTALSSVELE